MCKVHIYLNQNLKTNLKENTKLYNFKTINHKIYLIIQFTQGAIK